MQAAVLVRVHGVSGLTFQAPVGTPAKIFFAHSMDASGTFQELLNEPNLSVGSSNHQA